MPAGKVVKHPFDDELPIASGDPVVARAQLPLMGPVEIPVFLFLFRLGALRAGAGQKQVVFLMDESDQISAYQLSNASISVPNRHLGTAVGAGRQHDGDLLNGQAVEMKQ